MVQGGIANPPDRDRFIENLVKCIREKPGLVSNLEGLLKDSEEFKKINKEFKELTTDNIIALLKSKQNLLDGVVRDFRENKKDLEELLEQVNKVKGMEKELETLGNQLLAQGLISGAAVTTLTGALAGTLAIGGVTGALIVGGAALVGFVALVAIAAIGYAIYQHRGEIKEGAMKAGKEVKSFVKDVIDKLPTIQDRENNFEKLISNFMEKNLEAGEGKRTMFSNEIKIIKMLKNEEQRSAIQELVENGTIKNFSKDDMTRLLKKGLSTHEEDMQKLPNLMKKFLPKIMAIGSDIKEVEQKVNEKVAAMKPSSKVKESNSEQVDGNNIAK
ncbi:MULTISPECIES: glycine zipper family protein [unclassified Wolbachia]|uniref:glycine zipper family protein n=1 Tax=unclassified Wolbachia TaxID=2640676 RepID=UPI0022266F6E|nr:MULTISPECIES: glycine zipper family protein [unclassified Wolbachia]